MVGMKLTGGTELAKDLNALGGELKQSVLLAALVQAAEPMRSRMASMARRGDEPPHLADNIEISPVKRIEGVALHEDEAAVAVGPTKAFYYGWFLEWGTSRMGAKPFMRPAFDSTVQESLAALTTELGAALMTAAED